MVLTRNLVIGVIICVAFVFGFHTTTFAKCDDSRSVADQLSQKCQQADKTKDSTKTTKNEATTTTEGPSLTWTFIKLVGALAIILGLIYLLYRLVSKRTRASQSHGAIKNVGGVAIGNNRSVQLIRIGGEILVVGVGDSVQLLKEINDPDVVQALLHEEEAPDLIQKNVSKLMSWTKQSVKAKVTGNDNPKNKTIKFQKQLMELVKQRSNDVIKHMGKDSEK
ncbi:flagellar biosynthetic protein FliO [Pullulanibacillus pueri]|uniref:flagellar biosynthetic protein FliO n=1 Tax=Pullulanibacillus pueri TaxID=1437324 RepID=UPI001957BFF8